MTSSGTAVVTLPTDTQILNTEVYEGMPEADGDVVCTYTFTEKDGRTTVTLRVEHPNKEIRDMVMSSGMESGLQEGWDLLERVAVSLR